MLLLCVGYQKSIVIGDRKQVKGFMKYFSFSFLWALFKWFFSGKDKCGFSEFPTFGLKAWKQTYDIQTSELYWLI